MSLTNKLKYLWKYTTHSYKSVYFTKELAKIAIKVLIAINSSYFVNELAKTAIKLHTARINTHFVNKLAKIAIKVPAAKQYTFREWISWNSYKSVHRY